MFSIGDMVCYPMHGIGKIEAIEEHEILGKTAEYYIMQLLSSRVTAMIPIKNAELVGLRDIITADEAQDVIQYYQTTKPDIGSNNWNQRYRDNMDKLKAGTPQDVADVILCLKKRNSLKGLSSGERRMLATAVNIFISELAYALSATEKEVQKKLKLH